MHFFVRSFFFYAYHTYVYALFCFILHDLEIQLHVSSRHINYFPATNQNVFLNMLVKLIERFCCSEYLRLTSV